MKVPEGWSFCTLEELATVERGKFSVRPRNDPRYFGGTMPFVQTGDVTGAKTYLDSYTQTLNEEGVAVSKVFPAGTILITIAANIGDTAITSFDVACPDSIVAILPYLNKANVFWLNAVLETKKQDLDSQSTQNAQKNINLQVLRPLSLLTPPLPEQQKIAKILSTWDQAITTCEQLLVNSQQQKKALMQQLLTGKKRLLDDNGVRFSGEFKDVEVGEFLRESRIPSKNNDPRKRLTVRLNLKGVEQREYRGSESVDATLYFSRKFGQFIYGKQNIHKGAFGLIPEQFDGFDSSGDLPAFDFSGKCNSLWFFYYLSQDVFYLSLEDKMTGTGSKRLNPKAFFKMKLHSPSIEEQQKIATILTTADREIEGLQTKIAALKQEKKALMQQLLTGKRRVVIEPAQHQPA